MNLKIELASKSKHMQDEKTIKTWNWRPSEEEPKLEYSQEQSNLLVFKLIQGGYGLGRFVSNGQLKQFVTCENEAFRVDEVDKWVEVK